MPHAVNILLVEDNPGDARLLEEYLAEGLPDGFRITHCARLEEAIRSLEGGCYDVALLDLSLPDSKGLPTYLDLRGRAADLPIVILTGLDDERLASEAMQSGAQDYLSKNGLDAFRLARTIRYAIERKHWEETVRVREERINRIEKMEAIGRLSGGLAHNFNNILTAIIGNCELLAPLAATDAKAGRYVETMQAAASRAAALTRQLMAFCRKQPLNAVPLAIDAFARRLQDLVRGVLDPDTTLRVTLGAEGVNVLADDSQLEQAVLNLALNGRDAVEAGGTVTLATGVAELASPKPGLPDTIPAGSYGVLSIADDGGGIEPEILAHVFEPFFTTKQGGKSPGLGLATVHGILKQHQGFVQVETEVGRGSTFTLYLPRIQDQPPARPKPSERRSTRGLETLLLVEDEPQICAVLAEALSAHGYRILVASGGDEALFLFEQNATSIQLVVSDVDMPGMTGYELAQRLKAIRREVRIIFISGYAEEQVAPARDSGLIAAFLPKPFSAQTLARTIRDVLTQQPA
jgi:two-component system cell cycle sensor histidine kinase/response regulator CckA